jgi:hypothetical protein
MEVTLEIAYAKLQMMYADSQIRNEFLAAENNRLAKELSKEVSNEKIGTDK